MCQKAKCQQCANCQSRMRDNEERSNATSRVPEEQESSSLVRAESPSKED